MTDDNNEIDAPVEGQEYEHPPNTVTDVKTPSALKPRTDWSDLENEVTSQVYDGPVTPENHDRLLRDSGHDPDTFELVMPLKISNWDAQTAEGPATFWSYILSPRIE